MSNEKFTQGEWIVLITEDGAIVFCGNADPITGSDIIFMNEAVHDAHLISAAPDMYRALREAIDCGMVPISSVKEGGASRHSRQVQVADMIRAALAKADGEV